MVTIDGSSWTATYTDCTSIKYSSMPVPDSPHKPINHSIPRNQLGYYKSLLDYYRLLRGDRQDYDIQGMEIGAAIDLLKSQK